MSSHSEPRFMSPASCPAPERPGRQPFVWLAMCLLTAILLGLTPPAVQGAQPLPAARLTPEITFSAYNDTSPPLRSISPLASPQAKHKIIEQSGRPLPKAAFDAKNRLPAPQAAHLAPAGAGERLPGPLLSFDGISNVNALLPPDTNGDAGPNHYVQFVNVSFAIFSKTGELLYGPVPETTLFSNFGTGCEWHDSGDPIALYDHLADRWLLSYMAWPNSLPGNVYQCIAISQSGDPLGAWHRYAFLVERSKLNDYPKLGVWPDAYYMTANLFTLSSFAGAGVWAFERLAMLQGQPARLVHFDLQSVNPDFGGMLPADLDGPPPPLGAPGLFAEVDDASWIGPLDALRLWEFHVDWTAPANSTFGQAGQPNQILPTAPWSPLPCTGFTRDCIPQPNASGNAYLDAIGDRLMHRLVYRNFGDHATLLANHTVDAGNGRAGIRWYELRHTGAVWDIHQQSTYAGDWTGSTAHRWMASLAMDNRGNLAIGYSASSPTLYPSVRYIGRRAEDPPGVLPRLETSFVEGGGSQLSDASRWGDYSMMSIDPTDDCTFWYTNEYYAASSAADWQTRIGAFRFAGCTSPPQGALRGQIAAAGSGQPLAGALINLHGYITLTDGAGRYQFDALPPGSYSLHAAAAGHSSGLAAVTIAAGAVIVQDLTLTPLPATLLSGRVTDGGLRQGMPLYARLQISAPGVTHTVFTDPQTGAYQATLLRDQPHQIEVMAAVSDGYERVTQTVTPTLANAALDFALPTDDSCTAPGYRRVLAYFEDFETGDGGFTTEGPTSWAWGSPTSGPGRAFSGINLWATNLAGAYRNDEEGSLISPNIDLSAHAGAAIIVTWQQFLDSERGYDLAEVAASNDGGVTWTLIYGAVSGPVDLSWAGQQAQLGPDYAVANFRLRFSFRSDGNVTAPGWYIDDIGIGAVPLPPTTTYYQQDFEANDGGFSKTSVRGASSWAWGAPTSGPGGARSGRYVWATNLSGNYSDREDGFIVSPRIDLSSLAGRSARLTWQQWLLTEPSFDFAAIGASSDDGATWTRVYGPVSGSVAPAWIETFVDLPASFSVANFRFRFRLYTDSSVVLPGWYVDDANVQNTPPAVSLPCLAMPGSLLTGAVRDANTGRGLASAVLRNEATGRAINTLTTPDDPNLDDGFYQLFAAQAAETCFTATAAGSYGADQACLPIPDRATLAHDFHLSAGQLHIIPPAVAVTTTVGTPLTLTLGLSNTGALSLTFSLQQINLPPPAAAGAVEAPAAPPETSTNSAPATQILAGGRVLRSWPTRLPYAWGLGFDIEAEDLWLSNIGIFGGSNRDYRFLPNGEQTPDSIDVSGWVGSFAADMAFDPLTSHLWQVNMGGDNCLYELDPTRQISTGQRICPAFGAPQRGVAFDLGSGAFYTGGWDEQMLYEVDREGRVVRSYATGLAIAGLALNPMTGHLFVIANASMGLDLYVLDVRRNFDVVGGFNVAGFDAYSQAGLDMDCEGHLWAVNTTTQRVYEIESGESNACAWREIPWLTLSALQGTIGPGRSQPLHVTFDASLPPGVYRAQLHVRDDTPYRTPIIPIILTILPVS